MPKIRLDQINVSGFVTDSELLTASGDIVSQIPTNYVTDAELLTASGDIVTQIPVDYVTDAEFLTASGDIVSQIPADYVTGSELLTASGDIVSQIPVDYVTGSELVTASGDIVSQLSAYATDADVATISGHLVDQMVTNISGLADVSTSSVASGHFLQYNGASWINAAGAGGGVTDHGALTGLEDDDHSAIYHTHADITTISGHIVDQIPTNISGLSDVTTTAPASGEVLTYNGSAWVNQEASGGSSDPLTLTDQSSDPSAAADEIQLFMKDNRIYIVPHHGITLMLKPEYDILSNYPSLIDGLVSYWDMVAQAKDCHGTNHGTIAGATRAYGWKNRDTEPTYLFDGTDDYINVGTDSSLDIPSGTVSAWIKTSDTGAAYNGIFGTANGPNLFVHTSNLACYDYGNAAHRDSGDNVADGNWHHVVMTWNDGVTNGSTWYIDSVDAGDFTLGINGYGAYYIGQVQSDHDFTGNITHVGVWNRHLTSTEIGYLYNGGYGLLYG